MTSGGRGWIRTSVGVSQQIYSLPPLATRAPVQQANHGLCHVFVLPGYQWMGFWPCAVSQALADPK